MNVMGINICISMDVDTVGINMDVVMVGINMDVVMVGINMEGIMDAKEDEKMKKNTYYC